jgi:hypothetical protein
VLAGPHLIDEMAGAGLIARCDEGHWHLIKPRAEFQLMMDALFSKPKNCRGTDKAMDALYRRETE